MKKLIKIQASDKSFSANGGLLLGRDLFNTINLTNSVQDFLPKTKRNPRASNSKFEALILGFQAGNDHLDDWDELNNDPGFEAIVDRPYGAKSLGDFLRSFKGLSLYKLQSKLIDLSLALCSKINLKK